MHATVTAFVKLHDRKICRSGPANPHIPGLRRPQTRHTGAEACVSLPHDGHRMDPDVLRNIAVLVRRNAIAFVEPHAEVDQAAGERAERSMRVGLPGRRLAAGRAGHGALGLSKGGVIRGWHGRATDASSIWLESYEGPQSVPTRALGARAGHGSR